MDFSVTGPRGQQGKEGKEIDTAQYMSSGVISIKGGKANRIRASSSPSSFDLIVATVLSIAEMRSIKSHMPSSMIALLCCRSLSSVPSFRSLMGEGASPPYERCVT
jgi:hypothetical protein